MIAIRRRRNPERGVVLILCAICMAVLLVFVGFAVDFGFAYVTKADLAKAADAAALTGARYSGQGKDQATQLAKSAFAMNYGSPSRDTAPPVVSVSYPTDPNGNTLVQVNAQTTMKTSFLGMLPQYKTVNVATAAQAKATRVEVTLVLDRSGSMKTDGGSTYLAPAVANFINIWDDNYDSAAMVSFAIDSKVDFPMQTGNFKSAITKDAQKLNFNGSTFSDGALQKAFTQEMTTVTGKPLRVVVFFTDGGANTIQNSLTCANPSSSGTYDLGGQDPTPPATAAGVSFMSPSTGTASCSVNSAGVGTCCKDPANTTQTAKFPSAKLNGSTLPTWTDSGAAGGVMPWSTGSTTVPINYTNVHTDAEYRAIADANAMRSQQGITVFSIGLSVANGVDPTFLCQIANDPCSPNYDSSQPTGTSITVTDATQLDQAFQDIANEIRLRLTQ